MKGTDVLTGVLGRGDPLERLVDVVLRGTDEELLRGDLEALLGTELLTDVLPEVEELLAAAKVGRSKEEILFGQQVRRSQSEVTRWDKALARDVRDAISGYRRELDGILGRTEWDEYRLDSIRTEMEAAKTRLDAQLSGLADASATEASALALGTVDDPVRILLGNAPLPVARIPVSQIAIIRGYTPDLIRHATATTHKRVQRVLENKVLGGLSSKQAKERIGKLVGDLPGRGGREKLPGKVFTDLQLRTETIMRTEMNRIYNLASTTRIDDIAATIPGIGKTWIHNPGASLRPRRSHAALAGKVIFPGEGEQFELIGKDGTVYLIAGPHDPELPGSESINCHCRVRVSYSDEVAKEQERRGGFEKKPTGPPPSSTANS